MAAVDIIRHIVMMMSVDYNVNLFNVHVLLCGVDSYLLPGGSDSLHLHKNPIQAIIGPLACALVLFCARFFIIGEFIVCTNVVDLKSH